MAEIRHLENRHDFIFFCRGWSDLDKISETSAECHVNCGDVVEIETRCRIPIWRTFGRIQWHVIPEPPTTLQVLLPGEFNVIVQTYVSHCRVLPLGEFTVTIPESHATLQDAVTWRNQCHDRATLQGVRILSGMLKIVFSPILLFLFLMQFRLWRAAAFVSSPIQLFIFCAVRIRSRVLLLSNHWAIPRTLLHKSPLINFPAWYSKWRTYCNNATIQCKYLGKRLTFDFAHSTRLWQTERRTNKRTARKKMVLYTMRVYKMLVWMDRWTDLGWLSFAGVFMAACSTTIMLIVRSSWLLKQRDALA